MNKKLRNVFILACIVDFLIGLSWAFLIQYLFHIQLNTPLEWDKIITGGSILGILLVAIMTIYAFGGDHK